MNDAGRLPFPSFYRPLPLKFIRVFELQAGEFSDPIVGRLVEHHQSFAAYVLEYHGLLCGALSEAGSVKDDDNNSYLPVRSVFDSLLDNAQAELRRRAEGAPAGGFLQCMTWPSMCRIVYRTTSGLVGMGSRVTRPGDLVCRVRGSAVLMTLRRVHDSGASEVTGTTTETEAAMSIRCAHIEPTVVPARMKRGVLDGADFGEKAANFQII